MYKTKMSQSNLSFLFFLAIFFLFVFFSHQILLIAFTGIALGVIVEPVICYLIKNLRLSRVTAVNLAFGGSIGVLTFIAVLIFQFFSDQLYKFVQRLPNLAESASEKIGSYLDKSPFGEVASVETLSSAIEAITAPIISSISSGFQVLVCLGFGFIIAYYYCKDSKTYTNLVIKLVPERMKVAVENSMKAAARAVRSWFSAQVTSQFAVGSLTALGLWIVGAEFWLVYGLLTTIFCFIPYLGIFIVVAIAATVTLVSNASILPQVLLVFFIVQQIEGNIIMPRLMKIEASLPELALLLGVLLLGLWLGIIGAFVAPPLVAILFAVLREQKVID